MCVCGGVEVLDISLDMGVNEFLSHHQTKHDGNVNVGLGPKVSLLGSILQLFILNWSSCSLMIPPQIT